MDSWNELIEKYVSEPLIDGLVTPVWGYTQFDLLRCVMHNFGVSECSSKLFSPGDFSGASRVVNVIIDAVNFDVFYDVLSSHGVLNDYLKKGFRLYPLSTLAPSTTSTVLASLSSGLYPIEHGVLGYKVWVKEVGSIVNTIKFSPMPLGMRDILRNSGFEMKDIFNLETFFVRLGDRGVKSIALVYDYYLSSCFTNFIYEGAELKDVVWFLDQFRELGRLVRDSDFSVINCYVSVTDDIGHKYGPTSIEYHNTISLIFSWLLRSFDGVDSDTVVIISSDHGVVEVDPEKTFEIERDGPLMDKLIIPPCGERRFSYLYSRDIDDVSNYMRSELDEICIVTREDAFKLKLFGLAGNEKFKDRIGDVIVAVKGNYCLNFKYRMDEEDFDLRGHHGGLSLGEMIVPALILFPRR